MNFEYSGSVRWQHFLDSIQKPDHLFGEGTRPSESRLTETMNGAGDNTRLVALNTAHIRWTRPPVCATCYRPSRAAATQVGPVPGRAVTTESIGIQFPVLRAPLARNSEDRKFGLWAPAWCGTRARGSHRQTEGLCVAGGLSSQELQNRSLSPDFTGFESCAAVSKLGQIEQSFSVNFNVAESIAE